MFNPSGGKGSIVLARYESRFDPGVSRWYSIIGPVAQKYRRIRKGDPKRIVISTLPLPPTPSLPTPHSAPLRLFIRM